MADKDSVDLLMTFIDGGNPVQAESTTVIDPGDKDMMKDFQAGGFFEVDDFTFAVNLSDSESSGADNSLPARSNTRNASPGHSQPGTPNAQWKTGGGSSQQFAKYIDTGATTMYKADVQPVTITRQIDISSIKLLDYCFNHKKFEKAVLVKRKFTGKSDFHEAFVRLEFKEPLITGIEWDEGDVVREKMTFVCRGLTAIYKQQRPDGSLRAGTSPAIWKPQRVLASGSSGSS